jgi:hypothetical protein
MRGALPPKRSPETDLVEDTWVEERELTGAASANRW